MGNAVIKCVKYVNCFEVPDTKPDKDTLDIIAAQMEMYLSKKRETSEHKPDNICLNSVLKK